MDGWDASCHVHAEAAIMALACEAESPPPEGRRRVNVVDEILGAREVPIGINMNSCPLCFLLGKLLNQRQVDHQFIQLSNVTHEMVFPWDSPLFGIPESILLQIRDRLLLKLADLAETNGKQREAPRRRMWSPVPGAEVDDEVRF
ncbi:hypothetical protein LXA43DRAFT_1054402, partial [Ganoderma leucocontextum]